MTRLSLLLAFALALPLGALACGEGRDACAGVACGEGQVCIALAAAPTCVCDVAHEERDGGCAAIDEDTSDGGTGENE